MESKIRILIGKLEDNENIKIAHVNPTSYPRNVTDRYGYSFPSLCLFLLYVFFSLSSSPVSF